MTRYSVQLRDQIFVKVQVFKELEDFLFYDLKMQHNEQVIEVFIFQMWK